MPLQFPPAKTADLERGLEQAGGQALLGVRDTCRGRHAERGETEPERQPDQQRGREHHRRVVRRDTGPQEDRVGQDQAGEGEPGQRRGTEPAEQ